MTHLLAVFLLMLSLPVHAASMRLQVPDLTITLRTDTCTNQGILSFIEPPFRKHFRAADVLHKGKALKACWMAMPQSGDILIVDETGDNGPAPMSLFKPVVAM